MSPSRLQQELTLPNGQVIKNRIVKAAMEENMADEGQVPGPDLFRLYRTWSAGGAGLLITGNVMVHAHAMTGPGGVVLDEISPLEPFQNWAQSAKSSGSTVWMQISHPGRQVTRDMPGVAWAPSAIRLDIGSASGRFARPTEITQDQIRETIARFATTAMLAERAGFDGVQIHSAHGYLLSQFLSPRSNQRTDEWGGSLENRARMLLEVVRAVRAKVARTFAVAVKVNSADFLRGGFDPAEAGEVLRLLAPLGVDLVEISGGTYENPTMSGHSATQRTVAKEAYFLDLATQLESSSAVPLMVTGGIRRKCVAESVLDSGMSLVGMATALAFDPNLPEKWLSGRDVSVSGSRIRTRNATLAAAAELMRVTHQLRRIGRGKAPQPRIPWRLTVVGSLLRYRKLRSRYATWLHNR